MKSEYDLIVVGAGPAGSSVARFAAEKGVSVLLVEKRNEIGSPKRCGEGLSIHAMESVGLKPEPEWARQAIYGACIYSPSGKKVEARYKKPMGYTIERKQFDKHLAFIAARAGAEVIAGARVISLLKDNSKITGAEIKYQDKVFKVKSKILVAADGVESKIARFAGIDSTNRLSEICVGIQFEMGNIKFSDPTMLEFYMGKEIAPGGYIWIFPKGKDMANVGIGIRVNFAKKRAIEYLNDFVQKHKGLKDGSIIEINGGGIPVGKPLEQLVSDGFMVVGDAAHQVNAIHGGGVGEAMYAGKILADVAAKAIKDGDVSRERLSEYEKLWNEARGKKLRKLVLLREIVESLSDEDMEFLAEQLSGDDIINLISAKKFSTLAKIIVKRPSLLRLVPRLAGL